MKLLSVDTSSRVLSLAVSNKDSILAFQNVKLGRKLSTKITLKIEKILDKADVPLSKLDGFVVGLGPGFFTSLRVGLATIKGLSFATKKPVVGISSLDVLAFGMKSWEGQVAVLTDARRGLIYGAIYQRTNGLLKQLKSYSLSSIDDFLKKIKKPVKLVGDATEIYRSDIERILDKKQIDYQIAGEKFWYPQAKDLAMLGLKRFMKKNFDDINSLVPLYLYPEDCQVRT